MAHLVGHGDENGEQEEVGVEVVVPLYLVLRVGAEAVAHVEHEGDGQHEIVPIGLDEIVAGDGGGVNVMLPEWTDIILKNIYVNINPLVHSADKSGQIAPKISILKLEGVIQKISYERRDYESEDEKSLWE